MMFKKTFNAQKLASLRSVINTCQADTLLSIISFIISFFSMFKISSLTIVYCLCGTPAIIRTIKEIKEKSLSIDSLMTVAGIASCIIGNEIEGALLFLLFQIAKEMEEKIKEKSKNSILDTSRLLPNKTWIIRENKEISPRHISDVEIGSEILISPGEVVPLDGVIIKGNTVVTTAHLTGEPTEFSKSPGDILLSGSNNISSTVIIKTTKLSSESTLNRMINLMQTAAEISTEGQTWMESMKIAMPWQ